MALALNLITRLPRPCQRSARLLIARCFFKCHQSKRESKLSCFQLMMSKWTSELSHHIFSQPVEGMLSHQLEQNRIDGEKTIIQVKHPVLLTAEGVLENNPRVTYWELEKLMPRLAEPQWGTEEGARKVWICSSWSLCCWCSHQLRRRPGSEVLDNKIFTLLFWERLQSC